MARRTIATVAGILVAPMLAACANDSFTTAAPVADASTTDAEGPADDAGADSGIDASDAPFAGCADAGAPIVLTGPGALASFAIGFAGAPRMPRYSNALSGGPCPMPVDAAVTVPYRSFLVQNASAGTVRLSAWAACAVDDDAFLAFYAQRATPPTTDLETSECSGFVSEGAGNGGRGSPEANGCLWCPGLTVANQGTIALPSCATALVVIQQHDTAEGSKAPQVLRIRAD
jgi:hypothetical protein